MVFMEIPIVFMEIPIAFMGAFSMFLIEVIEVFFIRLF